jgi:hypothetical protein
MFFSSMPAWAITSTSDIIEPMKGYKGQTDESNRYLECIDYITSSERTHSFYLEGVMPISANGSEDLYEFYDKTIHSLALGLHVPEERIIRLSDHCGPETLMNVVVARPYDSDGFFNAKNTPYKFLDNVERLYDEYGLRTLSGSTDYSSRLPVSGCSAYAPLGLLGRCIVTYYDNSIVNMYMNAYYTNSSKVLSPLSTYPIDYMDPLCAAYGMRLNSDAYTVALMAGGRRNDSMRAWLPTVRRLTQDTPELLHYLIGIIKIINAAPFYDVKPGHPDRLMHLMNAKNCSMVRRNLSSTIRNLYDDGANATIMMTCIRTYMILLALALDRNDEGYTDITGLDAMAVSMLTDPKHTTTEFYEQLAELPLDLLKANIIMGDYIA